MRSRLASILLPLALAACGDDAVGKLPDAPVFADAAPDTTPADAAETLTLVHATLSGFQEMPPVESAARGSAIVGVNEAKTAIHIDLAHSGLTGITAAHLHFGTPGVGGPIILNVGAGDLPSPYQKVLTEADFVITDGVESFAAAAQAVLDGKTYLNIHTADAPAGALRGHVGPANFAASARGDHQSPPNGSNATGVTTLTIDDAQTTLTVNFTFANLFDADAVHIHYGALGTPGPILFTLRDTGGFGSPIDATLAAADLTPRPEHGIATMQDAIDAVLSGRAYLDIHSMAYPGGELRAQLGAVTLRSTLTPTQEVPSVTSTAVGQLVATVSADRSVVTTSTTFGGLQNTTAAHLHAGAHGVTGPAIIDLATATYSSPLAKTLVATDLKPNATYATFGAAVDALLAGKLYVNLHTQARPGGEIRGQVGMVRLRAPAMTPAKNNEVVVAAPNATGSADLVIAGDQRSVVVTYTYANLNPVTGADLRVGGAAAPTSGAAVLLNIATATFATGATFIVGPAGIPTTQSFEQVIGKLLDEGAFATIKTNVNANGEVRDQLLVP